MKKLIYSFFFLLVLFGSAVAQNLSSGLVAYYPFDNVNLANDLSGNGLNGVINGATLTTDRFGNPTGAYSFNGSSSQINVANFPQFFNNHDFSISIWLNSNSPSNPLRTYNGFISMGDNTSDHSFNFAYDSKNINFSYWDITNGSYYMTTDASKVMGQWTHLAIVYTGGQVKNYVNGVLSQTLNANSIQARSSKQLNIGAFMWDSQFFGGGIDDIRLYSRALTDCEIAELAELTLATPTFTASNANTSCYNGTANNFTINQVNGATKYIWGVDGVTDPSATGLTYSKVLPVGNHFITVTAEKVCTPDFANLSSSPLVSLVNVLPTPATPGTISPRNGVSYACLNTVKFYTVPTVPSATGYQWTLNGTVLTDQDGNNAAITLATAGANSLSVKAYSSSNGTFCYSPSSNPTAITVNSGPLTPTIVGNTQSCQYTGTNFSAVINSKSTLINAYSVSPADPTATYTWATDNGVLNTIATGQKGVIAYVNFPDITSSSQSVLNYTMSVSATNLCGSTLVQLPNAVVNNNFPVKPTIKCTDATCATLTLGQTIPNSSLTWTVYNPSGKTTYTNVTSIPNPGNVQIQLTVYNGTAGPTNVAACPYSAWYRPCDGTTGPYGTSSGRLAEQLTLPEESSYLIYPNPSTGTVTIETKGLAGKAYIFNTLGQEIAEVTLTENEYIYTVNLSSKGLYTFKIMSGSETTGYKVVVE